MSLSLKHDAMQEEVTDDKVVAKAEKAGIGSVSENPDQAAVPVHLAVTRTPTHQMKFCEMQRC